MKTKILVSIAIVVPLAASLLVAVFATATDYGPVAFDPTLVQQLDDEGQPLYVLSGDGNLYRNRPSEEPSGRGSFSQNNPTAVDSTSATDESNSITTSPRNASTWRFDACPDGVPVRDRGMEVCAQRCGPEGECPVGLSCVQDQIEGAAEGVCLQ